MPLAKGYRKTLIDMLKWLGLAILAGAVAGLGAGIFLKTLEFLTTVVKKFNFYFLAMPVSFLLCTLLCQKIAPRALGDGTGNLIDSVHKNYGKMDFKILPVKFVATLLTLVSGGSAGKVGPSAQIGGALVSKISDIFKLTEKDRQRLVICGISAGFSAVFGTPLAGAIFGIEVLYVGELLYEVFFQSVVSGVVGFRIASLLGVKHLAFSEIKLPVFTFPVFLELIACGFIFGLAALVFIKLNELFKEFREKIKLNPLLMAFISGGVLVLFALFVSKNFLGVGTQQVEQVLAGSKPRPFDFALKMLATVITLNFGGSGGIISPILFIGTTLGGTIGAYLKTGIAGTAAIGMVSVLAGCTNTPVAACVMAVELFGPKLGAFAALPAIISFILTGPKSVFPSQIVKI